MAQSYNVLDLDQAELFVKTNINSWWDNYDIIIWKESPGAWSKKSGLIKNGKWGIAKRIPISNDGNWRIPN
jgi:hypothetical protein